VVVQALPKGDRGEAAVELLTEVGVDVIIPWAAANCVAQWKADRVDRGHRRWLDAAHAAAKQSRRARFPQVEALATTSDVVSRVRSAACAVVLHETAESSISSVSAPHSGDLVVIVGPEGGISDEERAAFVAAGATTVRLGPSVLRTSSAGIAAVAALMAPTGRWTVAEAPRVEG
jgi:16S rRNA (uracil1498-N3)-methyltransferase